MANDLETIQVGQRFNSKDDVAFDTDLIEPEACKTLPGLFRMRAARAPHKVAYRFFDSNAQTWCERSWSDMAREAALVAASLAKEGVTVGDRVAIFLSNRCEWVACEQGALALGAVVVPLYANDRAENVGYILQDSGAKVLFLEGEEHWRLLQEIRPTLDRLKRIVNVTAFDRPNEAVNLISLAAWRSAQPLETDLSPIAADTLATVVYTSGTTGKPKGVMLSHHNILWNARSSIRQVAATSHDVFLSFLPLSHTLERTAGYYLPMMVGACVVYARSVPQLGEDLMTIRPSVLISVPRIYERVMIKVQSGLQEKGKAARKLFDMAVDIGWMRFQVEQGRRAWDPRLLLWPLLKRLVADKIVERLGGRIRVAVCGGAPLSFPVARTFLGLGVPIVQGYGMTETSPVISVNTLNENDPKSVGTPLQDVQVKLADNGELLVKSPGVMLGYWKNDEATRKTIDESGWLHTGDKAEIRDRHVFITGRVKEIIVLANGEKVPPADMESALTLDPLFEQALVFGEGKPFLCAFLVLSRTQWERFKAQESFAGDDAQLLSDTAVHAKISARLSHCLRRFPGYAQVRRFVLDVEPWTVEAGLITPTLKLRRERIVEKYQARLSELYRGH